MGAQSAPRRAWFYGKMLEGCVKFKLVLVRNAHPEFLNTNFSLSFVNVLFFVNLGARLKVNIT